MSKTDNLCQGTCQLSHSASQVTAGSTDPWKMSYSPVICTGNHVMLRRLLNWDVYKPKAMNALGMQNTHKVNSRGIIVFQNPRQFKNQFTPTFCFTNQEPQ